MKHFFHPEAEAELFQIIEYYEDQQSGLGFEFAEEIHATIARIKEYPHAWTSIARDIRRCLTNRFPCSIIYQTKGDRLFIIAIAGLQRYPGYWKERASQRVNPPSPGISEP